MGKYLLVSDLHIRIENLELSRKFLDLIYKKAVEEGLTVIVAGDLFHTKAIIRSECLNLVLEYFKKPNWSIVVLVGNHDWENINYTGHSLESLKLLSNVSVVDKVDDIGDISFIPYCSNDDFESSIKVIKSPFLVCHHGIQGFMMNNIEKDRDGIRYEKLSQFRMVFCGHYHIPQESQNIMYIGSPYQQDFSESGQMKRMVVLDTHNHTWETVFIKEFPMFYIVSLSTDDIFNKEHKIPVCSDDDHIRFDIEGTKDQIKLITKELIKKKYNLNCDVRLNTRVVEEIKNITIEDTLNYDMMFKKWVDIQDIKLNKEKIKQLGSEVLNACI